MGFIVVCKVTLTLPTWGLSPEGYGLIGSGLFKKSARGEHLWQGCLEREFNPPWREAGPPNHHDDKVDSDQ